MSKNEKWTDKKIQKLFEDKFLSKIHSPEFNFGCVFLYADIEKKDPRVGVITKDSRLRMISNQLSPNHIIMLSNALYSLVQQFASPITAFNFREELDALITEVMTNHDGGNA
ncbi:hypothetical protein Megvenef_01381 [Candidatus Megaera venefica]|uniref:Uncharacterized protein n=1 Tax=Candidatus Megaera venefica TaxID=2055910 RepID=A0ABU5NE06_9RICK|nr:hypothetical protein [Candidatus Megaera venefica]MEA0971403.1 hypothetical protein [Candidatus Megaera venefica]